MNPCKIAEISTLSWDVSVGGEHYTANIKCGEDCIRDVSYVMDEHQARKFNLKEKSAGWSFGCEKYKPGDTSNRFWSIDECLKRCSEVAIEKWPDLKLILWGDTANPCHAVWCYSAKTKKKLDTLFKKSNALYDKTFDPFTVYPAQCKKIWGEWDAIIKEIKQD